MATISKASIPAKTLKVFEKYPTTVGQAIRNYVREQAGQACEAAIAQADPGVYNVSLQGIDIVRYTDDTMDLSATFEGSVGNERRNYQIPVHMELPALRGMKAAIAHMMRYAAEDNFHTARAKSAPLTTNAALESQIREALAGTKYPSDASYITAVTAADGASYLGERFDPQNEPFNYHPGQPARYKEPRVVGEPGRVYVSTDSRMGLAGHEILHILAPKDGKLVVESSRVLSMS